MSERNQPSDKGPRADRFAIEVYGELRVAAARVLRGRRVGHSLQPTSLVHEAFLRLREARNIDWQGRTHFFAVACTQMRRILVERFRAANAQKRGAGWRRVTLDERLTPSRDGSVDLLELHDALRRLESLSARRGKVAELRLLVGCSVDETAAIVGVSASTVKDDWRLARAWLARELAGSSGG